MNLAYFRKSTFSMDHTVENLMSNAKKLGFEVFGVIEISEGKKLVQICSSKWLQNIIKEDRNVFGLLPCAVLVYEENGEVIVGSANPAVLGGVSQNQTIQDIAAEAEPVIRKLINESSGVDELKPNKIKLYSTTTRPYCKMEQKWLEDNKIEYELIYVDRDQKTAEYLVNKTGQMGVPVTELEYSGMDSEFVIGFNKYALEKMVK